MDYNNDSESKVHMGRNVAKFRVLKGFKQEKLAQMIGLPNQQTLSRLENMKEIDLDMLEKIAPILGVSAEVLQKMPEENGSLIIENSTFEEGSVVGNVNTDNKIDNSHQPVDQLIELLKEKDRAEQKRIEVMENRIKELEDLIRKNSK